MWIFKKYLLNLFDYVNKDSEKLHTNSIYITKYYQLFEFMSGKNIRAFSTS